MICLTWLTYMFRPPVLRWPLLWAGRLVVTHAYVCGRDPKLNTRNVTHFAPPSSYPWECVSEPVLVLLCPSLSSSVLPILTGPLSLVVPSNLNLTSNLIGPHLFFFSSPLICDYYYLHLCLAFLFVLFFLVFLFIMTCSCFCFLYSNYSCELIRFIMIFF